MLQVSHHRDNPAGLAGQGRRAAKRAKAGFLLFGPSNIAAERRAPAAIDEIPVMYARTSYTFLCIASSMPW